MKKIFLAVALIATLCLTGCGSLNDKDIRNNFIKEIEGLNAYIIEGTLTITNNDDNYEYDVVANYQKEDNYKVSLINKANNYEQIILKNGEEVYVLTHKGLTFFKTRSKTFQYKGFYMNEYRNFFIEKYGIIISNFKRRYLNECRIRDIKGVNG